jgi:hypothetical protein
VNCTVQFNPVFRVIGSGPHVPPAGTCVKSAAFAPVTVKAEIVSVAVPVLENMRVVGALDTPTGWLPKGSGFGAMAMADPFVPFPWSMITCGELDDVSVIVKVAVRVPGALGVNVKEIGQAIWGLY